MPFLFDMMICMRIIKSKLKNGARLIKIPMPSTETVTVLVLVGTGSKYESKEQAGISHFLEHLMFKGTKKRPTTLAISEELDKVGGVFNAFTGDEYTGYWAKMDKSHLVLALDIISDILQNSLFKSSEIERERGVILEEIKMYKDIPMQYVGQLFEKLLYGNQPAGRSIIGFAKNIRNFKRKDFIDYYNSQYKTDNIVICIAGNIEKLKDIKFDFKSGKPKSKLAVREIQIKPNVFVHKKQTDQTHLCLGVRAYDMKHKDSYALSLLATILGGMMSSRMWISIREREGLAYYIKTSYERSTDTGYLVTQAGVDHNKIKKAVSAILNEYKKADKVSEKELNKAKENIKGKLLMGLESSDAVASFIANQELLTLKTLTPEQIIDKINKVTIYDIKRVAKDIFQNRNLNLCLITPKQLNYQPILLLK